MPSSTFALSGSGPQQGYIWLSYSSYSQSGNYSTWYWEAIFKNNGGLQWINDGNRWRVTGFAATGWYNFSIPSSWVGTNDHALQSGAYFTKMHNADGYLSAGTMTLTIETNHTGIGDGSGGVSSGTPPRIPKVPDAPGAPTFVSAESDSLKFTITAPADNGGSAITTYEMRVRTTAGVVVGTWQATGSSQTTPSSLDLDPATSYRVDYRAKNAIGWGAFGAYTTMTTEAGVFVSTGSAWVAASPKVSTGSAWQSAAPQISTGSVWEDPDV